jgi:hypothetical protein
MNVVLKIVTMALLASGLPIGCAAAPSPITGPYTKADRLPVAQIDLSADRIQASAFKSNPKLDCQFLRSDLCVAVGIDMDHNDHRTKDAGLRLFLVEKTNSGYKVRDRSKGSNSAYNLTPTFYRSGDSWVILAENGAEYSYGTRVFMFKDNTMNDLGALNVAFNRKFGEIKTNGVTTPITNEVSIVPYTVISTVNQELVFSFTQDVEHNPGGNDQKPIAKERIRYTYSGGKLQEVIDPEKTAAFPDRKLGSNTLQGQFKKLEQGDYLYAFVTTPTDLVSFLIDGNESCFLQQTKGQKLTLDYDKVERYTPEMGGYRAVNIIRQIRTPKSDLRTWQGQVTPAQLAQCEQR